MSSKDSLNTQENIKILSNMSSMEHEQVVFCQDNETGLKAIIAIHNTTLGPALGGTRMWNYSNEADALNDVLRLSRGMTFKAAISGLALGGGKAVIIGDSSKDKTPELLQRFGKFVDTLSGNYITAEDVGMCADDMTHIRKETLHVTGLPQEMGGGGDPSPVTAYGVYMGMKASAKFLWGSDDLEGKRVLVQGVGHVGENVVKHLSEERAEIFINDINIENLMRVSKKYNASIVNGDELYAFEMDIYAPCALGATINDHTLSLLKCKIIAGAANNQLENEIKHSEILKEKGIIYAPDFLINAGGLINVFSELNGYDETDAYAKTKEIYNTTLEILHKAKNDGVTTHSAALSIAKERLLIPMNS